MIFLPKELINQILLFSGHLVILEGKLYPIRKISPEKKYLIENILIQNPVETGFTIFNNLVKFVTLDITDIKYNSKICKFYVISKYLSEESDYKYHVMLTNTPYIYYDTSED